MNYMFRDQLVIALAAGGFVPPEDLLAKAHEITEKACAEWGHIFQRPGEIVVNPPEYCARCGKSGAVVSDEYES